MIASCIKLDCLFLLPIGPTGKRFRSRNELKAFFEKTGETVLQPEHFDFSTFGTNAVNLPKEYQNKNKTNNTVVPGPPTSQDSSGMPKLTPMAPGKLNLDNGHYGIQLQKSFITIFCSIVCLF